VLANPTDIQQVILNLGSNAAHAMRERGGVLAISLEPCQLERPLKVTIGTLGAGEYRCLRIADTGTGIAPQVAARMFDPFFTTKRMGEGTGLGLSIVLGIVLAHGGAIEVRSKIGEGTTFEIYLPAATGDDEGAGDEEPIRTTGSGQRIAIVDDEVAITEAGRLALSRNGYVPTTFNRAQELLDFLAAGGKAFDLIITDQTMPGMTGLELIRTLRDSGNARPVIILSGNARFVSQEDLADLGDVKFMPKPFEISGLMERISVMLSLAR
jgi:CheY-like chemotaxis protein